MLPLSYMEATKKRWSVARTTWGRERRESGMELWLECTAGDHERDITTTQGVKT